MDEILKVITSANDWIFLVFSFFFGVVAKYFLNRMLTPKIEVEKAIILDYDSKLPYIKVCNNSSFKWNIAYDIRIFIYYFNNKQNRTPVLTSYNREGVIRTTKEDEKKNPAMIPITPTNNKERFEELGSNYTLHVVVVYRNRFSTFSVVEQDCCPSSLQ